MASSFQQTDGRRVEGTFTNVTKCGLNELFLVLCMLSQTSSVKEWKVTRNYVKWSVAIQKLS